MVSRLRRAARTRKFVFLGFRKEYYSERGYRFEARIPKRMNIVNAMNDGIT